MSRARRLTLAFAALALLTGCPHNIKLDPLDPDAEVFVNGVSRGHGQVEYTTPTYNLPETIGVKVVPAKGAPYTLSIERQFDFTNAVIGGAAALASGAFLIGSDLAARRTPVFSIGYELTTLPLAILTSYKVNDYYDLTKLHTGGLDRAVARYLEEAGDLPALRVEAL